MTNLQHHYTEACKVMQNKETTQSESLAATNKRTETKIQTEDHGAYKLHQFQIQPLKPRTTSQMDSWPHFDDLNDVNL